MLIDNHNRPINYLRLAVTDRCNLRCHYCMPAEGLTWLPRTELLSYEEMVRLCTLLTNMGINKIRITGGEPFVRKDLMMLLESLSKLSQLKELTLTTNGLLTAPHVPELKNFGIRSVNLSLDTIDSGRFMAITRRNELPKVLKTLDALLNNNIKVKINAVVMDKLNTQDIIPLTQMTKNLPVDIRFIEEMPFNGDGHSFSGITWDHKHILNTIRQSFPDIQKLKDPEFSTSYNYHIPGHQGNVGIIASYSRTFCGTCNRLRITPEGMLKTCLYDNGVLDIKQLLRSNKSDEQVAFYISRAIANRTIDGWETEKKSNLSNVHGSMATIGG